MTVSINGVYSHNYIDGVLVKETLNPANEIVNRGHYAATTLSTVDADLDTANIKNGITMFGFAGSADVQDISDATAIEAEVLSPETFYAVSGGIRTGTMATRTLNPANETVQAGYYAATTLSTVDAQLANANILSGVNIFGFVGVATVQDIGAADAVLADVKNGKTFFSVTGGIKTGNLATVAITAGSNAYPAGYHVGNGGGLDAIDLDLVTANIKSGITIFNVAGAATVRDIADANAILSDVKTGRTFYSVTGARKTGNLATVALAAGANAYPAGYHAGAASLTAVDGDLAAGNIADGITIFGVLGTFTGGALVEDIVSGTISTITTTGTLSRGYLNQSVTTGTDYDLASDTTTFAADSLAVGVGFCGVETPGSSDFKMRLYMDGVQVAETGFIASGGATAVIEGTRALSGSTICKVALHNYNVADKNATFVAGNASGDPIPAAIGVGSVKTA